MRNENREYRENRRIEGDNDGAVPILETVVVVVVVITCSCDDSIPLCPPSIQELRLSVP